MARPYSIALTLHVDLVTCHCLVFVRKPHLTYVPFGRVMMHCLCYFLAEECELYEYLAPYRDGHSSCPALLGLVDQGIPLLAF